MLREPLSGWGYNDTKSIACGCISVNQAKKYIRTIASEHTIPEGSCLYCIKAEFDFASTAKTQLSRNELVKQGDIKQTEVGRLDITVSMINGRKCSRTKCFENIRNGKCTDKFMIDIIGKKFFPEQYKDTKTKQR